MQSFPAPRLATLNALFAALLALQACGGGGGDDTDSATAAPTPTPAPSPAPPAPAPAPSPAPAPAPAPTPAPAPAPNPDITCGIANFQAEVLRVVNQYRAAGASCGARGVYPPAAALAWQSQLTSAAYGHSRDMADHNYFSHTSLDGRSLSDRINATGYVWSSIGENIAAGYGSIQAVVDGWIASDGHCANLMNPNFTQFGLACARNDTSTYRVYWTQNLGRPR
jgi:uncharacterized protein YkwD